MKGSKPAFVVNVLVARTRWNRPIPVRLEAYVEFSRRIEAGLEKLVTRWSHLAAPGALGLRRRGIRGQA